jgi:hypothetical protein
MITGLCATLKGYHVTSAPETSPAPQTLPLESALPIYGCTTELWQTPVYSPVHCLPPLISPLGFDNLPLGIPEAERSRHRKPLQTGPVLYIMCALLSPPPPLPKTFLATSPSLFHPQYYKSTMYQSGRGNALHTNTGNKGLEATAVVGAVC